MVKITKAPNKYTLPNFSIIGKKKSVNTFEYSILKTNF